MKLTPFMKLTTWIVAGGIAATGLVMAQRPGFGPLRFAAILGASGADAPRSPLARLQSYLSSNQLTDAQLASIEEIQEAARTAAESHFEQMRAQQQALQTALNATPVDTAAVVSAQSAIKAMRAEVVQLRTSARTQSLALLNPAQQMKMTELEAAAALQDEVHAAGAMGLLAAPEGGRGPGGPGFGRRGGRGSKGPDFDGPDGGFEGPGFEGPDFDGRGFGGHRGGRGPRGGF